MPTLCVLRHAKSGWSTGAVDHDRPLVDRGRAAAPLVGRWLREHGYAPALVLCSSARRCVETLRALGDLGDAEVEITGELYLAAARQWVQRLRAIPGDRSPVLVVGHNPGLQRLVVDLAGGSAAAGRIAQSFPTAALAVLEVGTPWSGIERAPARLHAFVRPADGRYGGCGVMAPQRPRIGEGRRAGAGSPPEDDRKESRRDEGPAAGG